MIKVSTFCSGIGAAEQAIKELNVPHKVVFAAEKDKYARATYEANHDAELMIHDMCEPDYIGEQYYSDINISGLPCQAFSLAGKRLGELDKRGLLFYDFYRYVKNQQPKIFIIENVKGLLSQDNGKTFQNWLQLLGRSLNTMEQLYIHEDSLEYNLHYQVLNSKDFGVPQNRERIFIVGIRKDLPNDFRFPIGWKLDKRLRDVLEANVDEKYYLSEKMIAGFLKHKERHELRGNGFAFKPHDEDAETSSTITTKYGNRPTDFFLKVKEATKKGYDIAEPGDSINISNPNSKTRRGRVGKEIANTLETSCNQVVLEPELIQIAQIDGFESEGRIYDSNGIARTIKDGGGGGAKTGWYKIDEEIKVIANLPGKNESNNRIYSIDGISPTILAGNNGGGQSPVKHLTKDSRIRRLTPLECFRLQAFSDEFFYKSKYESQEFSKEILLKNPKHKGKRIFSDQERIERMSDSQLYKQAGNTITVTVIKAIINNLLHLLK